MRATIGRRRLLQGAAALGMGALLPGPARAARTGQVFVSTEKGNEVVVLDGGLNVTKRIPTSRRPRDMHFTADHARIFVACGDDDVIDVIDLGRLEVVDSIPTGPSPEEFAFSPDGRLIYVSNEEYSQLEAIEVESRTSVLQVPTGAEPEGVIVAPDGKTLYVTSEVADMVHMVDLATGVVTDSIVVGTRPRRFIFSGDGTQLWVSCELSGEIYVIDRATNAIVGEPLVFTPPGFRPEDVTPVGMAITRDGSRVLLSLGRANHVAIIDAASHQVLQYVLVGSRAWSVDLAADDSIAIVANGLSDDITLIDLHAMQAVKSVPVGRVPHTVLIDD